MNNGIRKLSSLKKLATGNLSLFLFANALYSLSTGLINILAPFILDTKVYEDFIYVFHNIMMLTSIFAVGLVPTMLRFYKYDKEKYTCYYLTTSTAVYAVLLLLGLFVENPLSALLKITRPSLSENFAIYLSIAFSILYIFNRGLLTAQNRYKNITIGIVIIFVIRIVALLLIAGLRIKDFNLILLGVCILPFSYELVVYLKGILKVGRCSFKDYGAFFIFGVKISIVGILYTSTNQIFLVHTKGADGSLAAALSFAGGLVGIINILNTTMSSYFLGKLDARDKSSINSYLDKVGRFRKYYFLALLIVCAIVFVLIFHVYPTNASQVAWLCVVTLLQTGIIFYVGLYSLMVKTFDLLNRQIIIYLIGFVVVFGIVSFIPFSCEYVVFEYFAVSAIIILFEIMVARMAMRYIAKMRNN